MIPTVRTPPFRLPPKAPDLDRMVDEALHKLSPDHERLLRSWFSLHDSPHAAPLMRPNADQLRTALRAIRRLALSNVEPR